MIGRPDVLLRLADEWLKLVESLRKAHLAHGDLQHGNLLVKDGRLRLVDFDGMFVPAMAGRMACELGHEHYQHPARDARFFNTSLDNFSSLVIYLSLISLAEAPTLWAEHHDESLLFTRSDWQRPGSSVLLSKIKRIGPEHRRLAEVLQSAAEDDPASVPCIVDLVKSASKLPVWMREPLDLEVRELRILPAGDPTSEGKLAARQREREPVPQQIEQTDKIPTAPAAVAINWARLIRSATVSALFMTFGIGLPGLLFAAIWWPLLAWVYGLFAATVPYTRVLVWSTYVAVCFSVGLVSSLRFELQGARNSMPSPATSYGLPHCGPTTTGAMTARQPAPTKLLALTSSAIWRIAFARHISERTAIGLSRYHYEIALCSLQPMLLAPLAIVAASFVLPGEGRAMLDENVYDVILM